MTTITTDPARVAVLRALTGLDAWATVEEIAVAAERNSQTVRREVGVLRTLGLVRVDVTERSIANGVYAPRTKRVQVYRATEAGRAAVASW